MVGEERDVGARESWMGMEPFQFVRWTSSADGNGHDADEVESGMNPITILLLLIFRSL